MTPQQQAHLATFEQAHAHAKTVADWWFARWSKARRKSGKGSPLLASLAFERAAEEQQLAAGREAAARRYVGLDPSE